MNEPDKKWPLDYAVPPKRRKTTIRVQWPAFTIALSCLGVSIAGIASVALNQTAGLACFNGFCVVPIFAILSAIYLYASLNIDGRGDDEDKSAG